MERTVRLSELVSWTIAPVPIWRRVARWLSTLGFFCGVVAIGGMGSVSGPDQVDPRVETDSDECLGVVTVKGAGGGMPLAYPSTQPVAIYRDRATITPGLHEVVLPLATMHVERARPAKLSWRRPRAADAIWTVEVAGPQTALTFRGRWLLLAQLGALGGWPEPD